MSACIVLVSVCNPLVIVFPIACNALARPVTTRTLLAGIKTARGLLSTPAVRIRTAIMSSQKELFINKRIPGVETYYPVSEPTIGAPFPSVCISFDLQIYLSQSVLQDVFPQNKTIPALFKPLTLRGVEFKNRIFVSPMCQYSSENGHASDHHFVHIGQFVLGGAGAIIMEATAVLPEGRISPEDAGLWTDSQIAPLKRIVDFAHAHGSKIGVQLGHAGRKSSTYAPWVAHTPGKPRPEGATASVDENGWPEQGTVALSGR